MTTEPLESSQDIKIIDYMNKVFDLNLKNIPLTRYIHAFLHELGHHIDIGDANTEELEQYMIQWYDTTNKDYGYNISLGGETGHGLYGENHPMYGKHHSEEARQKISESNKGKCHTEEAKKKRLALEAAKDEHKALMSAIEAFYKQQEQVVNEAYLNREILISEREQRISEIQDRHRRTRIAAD